MNYLAHIFLSGNNRQLQVGNFIGDFVKGKSHEDFPKQIQEGILLHRQIDSFTDNHPIFLETVRFMRPTFGRYSGIIADMYFDYFLASDFKRYSPKLSLNCFAANFYISAILNYKHLPQQVKGFLFHFITTNKLKKYATYQGLHRALQIMAHFKTSAIDPELSISFLKENEETLRGLFHTFMPQVTSRFK